MLHSRARKARRKAQQEAYSRHRQQYPIGQNTEDFLNVCPAAYDEISRDKDLRRKKYV